MNKVYFILFLPLLLSVVDCSSTTDKEEYAVQMVEDLEYAGHGTVHLDTLFAFATENVVRQTKPYFFSVVDSTLHVFNSRDTTLVSIKLSVDGPVILKSLKCSIFEAGIDAIRVLKISPIGEIFLFDELSLVSLDRHGNFVDYQFFWNNNSDKFIPGVFEDHFEPVFIDEDRVRMYVHANVNNGYESKEYYNHSIEAIFNVRTKKVESFIEVNYPEIYRTQLFGPLTPIDRIIVENVSFYSFPLSPVIHSSDSSGTYKFRAPWPEERNLRGIPFSNTNADSQTLMDLLLENPTYVFLDFWSEQGLLHRGYAHYMSLRNPDGTYNTLQNKVLSGMFVDLKNKRYYTSDSYYGGAINTHIGTISLRISPDNQILYIVRYRFEAI